MFVQLVTKIPSGKISCWEDIFTYLSKLYHKTVSKLPDRWLPLADKNNDLIPYWRLVTYRGVLESGKGGTKEMQREKLIEEGLPIVQRGTIEGSYKVENYKEYMFNFDALKIVEI